jgi:hypothetical protein
MLVVVEESCGDDDDDPNNRRLVSSQKSTTAMPDRLSPNTRCIHCCFGGRRRFLRLAAAFPGMGD